MENDFQPLLSVVIPVYNSEKFLLACLDSVIAQTYQNLEIIVVDNGSSGNVKAIYKEYMNEHQEFRWQFIHMDKNIGLFHARIKGFEKASGEYFTTMDSDDRLSIDFYYQLVTKALETGADVVVGGYIHDFVGDELKYRTMNEFDLCDFCWEGEEILAHYMKACGRSFNYHALWCKIYSIKVFKRAQKALKSITEPIVMCEDILGSAILLGAASKLVNVHHVYYIHAIYPEAASADIAANDAKIISAIESSGRAFEYLKNYLVSTSKFQQYKIQFELFRKKFFTILCTHLYDSNLPFRQKQSLYKRVCRLTEQKEPFFAKAEDWLFECRNARFCDGLEKALKLIREESVEIVSFDVFDTLVERPCAKPDDLFEFLSKRFNAYRKNVKYIDFAKLRSTAERVARENVVQKNPFFHEVQLKEIYAELVKMGVLNAQEAQEFQRLEIEMEYRFCKTRSMGKYLYDFARRAGKRIVCISDMYLPADVILEILRSNGYTEIERLYVSSEKRVCKYDGKLFQAALKDLKVKPKDICHIGDNYISDFCAPEKLGMRHFYLASAAEMFMGRNGLVYSGQSFQQIVGDENDSVGAYGYLGTRCLFGLASKKTFGNPFVHFDESSDFNSNPNVIGYYLLGTYVFSVAKWLLENARKKGYVTIHFIARDGFLIKQAYDILAAHSDKPAPASNYLYVSREALMPVMIHTKADLFAPISLLDYKNYTPLSFLKLMEKVIPPDVFARRKNILRQCRILPDEYFENELQWYQFVGVYAEKFYFQERIEAYLSELREAFGKMIGPNDCTFDAGYSVRTETLLYEILGYKLPPYYLYANEERAFRQADSLGVPLNTFHREPASVVDMIITEHFICSTSGSCCGYDIRDGKFEYQFAKPNVDRETAFLIDLVQQRAAELVLDFVETFPEWESLCYRFTERPFQYYLKCAKEFDKGIFFKLKNRDTNSSFAQEAKLIDIWKTTPYVPDQPAAPIPYPAPPNVVYQVIDNTVGVKGALINYFKKHLPHWMHPMAKRVKHFLKW